MKKKKKNFFTKIIFCIFLICIIIFFVKVTEKKILSFFYKTEYSEYVEKYSSEYNIDRKLLYAIIKNESGFDSNAVSSAGAVGLMQIMDETANDVSKKLDLKEYDLYLPEDNIKIGAKYFSDLLEKYETPALALAAYNAGFGNVDNWISNGIIKNDGSDYENIPYKETNMYVRKILRDYEIYQNKT